MAGAFAQGGFTTNSHQGIGGSRLVKFCSSTKNPSKVTNKSSGIHGKQSKYLQISIQNHQTSSKIIKSPPQTSQNQCTTHQNPSKILSTLEELLDKELELRQAQGSILFGENRQEESWIFQKYPQMLQTSMPRTIKMGPLPVTIGVRYNPYKWPYKSVTGVISPL